MKRWLYPLLVVGAVATLTVGGTRAFAQFSPGGGGPQGGPGGMQPPMPHPPKAEMQANNAGVFVLAGPNLVKYTLGTLAEAGTVALADAPTAPTTATQNQQPPKPPAPGAFLLTKDSTGLVLVVIGNTFYNIDATTLAVKVKATLPEPAKPTDQATGTAQTRPAGRGARAGVQGGQGQGQGQAQGQGGPGMGGPGMMGGPGIGQGGPGMGGPGGPGPMGGAPELVLQGSVLYVQRGPEILGVNIADGTVTGTATLPKPVQPQPPTQQ